MNRLKIFFASIVAVLAVSAAAAAQSSLVSLDGSSVDVTKQRGKVVVLAVGASWLPLSSRQAEITNILVKKYSSRPVVFYFVATDSDNAKSKNFASAAVIREFASKNRLTIPILRDPDGGVVMRGLKVEQVPSFVIIDKTGAVSGEPFGGIDPKYDLSVPISKAIDSLL